MINDKNTVIQKLKEEIEKFNNDREWKQYHCPKNLVMKIAIEAAELMEYFQWTNTEDSWDVKEPTLQKIKDEIADVIICTLNLSNILNIDVSNAVIEKIKKNEQKYPVDLVKGKA